MKQLVTALALAALFVSTGSAQEQERRENTPERQEADGNERRDYGRGRIGVEDPAEFATEGREIFSGPQRGERLPEFTATVLAGEHKGAELNPLADSGDRAHILFFQDENGVAIRGLFGLVRAIGQIEQKTDLDLTISCVFLTDDAETILNSYERVFPSLQEQGIDLIAVSNDGREGPGAYGFDRNVAQTIILSRNGEVTRNFVFPQGLLLADPHVLGGIAELIGEDRETVSRWLSEAAEENARMEARRTEDPQAEAKAAFRRKLGEFVEAGKLTREEAGELYRVAFPESEVRERRR